MLKSLDIDVMDKLIAKQRYHIKEGRIEYKETNPLDIIKESEKLSFHIYRFLAETDDDLELNASIDMLNKINFCIDEEKFYEAEMYITILESLLQLEIKFPQRLKDISKIVVHGPITFRNLVNIDLERKNLPVEIRECIDYEFIEKLIIKHLRKENSYHEIDKEITQEDLLKETKNIYKYIRASFRNDNDYYIYKEATDFIKEIVYDIDAGDFHEAKIGITVLSLLLKRRVKYKEALLDIREITKKKPITIANLKDLKNIGRKR